MPDRTGDRKCLVGCHIFHLIKYVGKSDSDAKCQNAVYGTWCLNFVSAIGCQAPLYFPGGLCVIFY